VLEQTCRLSYLSVCLSVGSLGELWKNVCLDLDAVLDGEWSRSRMGALDGGGDRRTGRGSFGGKYGASHCYQRGYCGV